jgi:subtilase family serine protease
VLPAQEVAPAIRIVDRIDESQLVTLRGNTHPLANAQNDRGRVSPDLPMTDLILVLSRSPEQQAAFEKFVASQYDPASPNFHRWLEPAEVGQNFGPSENDIAALSNWLTGHGFSVDVVTNDRMSIRFSGTAAQVESAFHTEIHNLLVKNVAHIGNMTDPQIPAALSPAVVGVKALHNFFAHPLHRLGSQVMRDAETGKWKRNASPLAAATRLSGVVSGSPVGDAATRATARPQFGISVGGTSPYLVEDVAPYDFATIYNILPLWNAGIDGTGQTIAIAGTSDIDPNDVATFRNFFGLPTGNAVNTPIRISGNSQPLTVCSNTSLTALCGQGDLVENSLDVEWSGSVAKNAQIVLVASYVPPGSTDDGLYDSESYIVNNLTARIMNVSYGECELGNGTAGNVQYYDLWQTAASEGIAVFVATGDSGAASCDQGGDQGGNLLPYPAEFGLSVSGLASTPWNTAVGGTDFNWCPLASTTECTPAPYWSATANASAGQSTALGYVPEVPWNDTCTNPLALAWMENFWSGVYTVTDAETGCNAFVVEYNLLNNAQYYSLLYLVDTIGGSGGASGCVVSNSAASTCTTGSTSTGATTNPDTLAAQASLPLYNNGWPKPSWQTGVSGIPSDGVRDLPDVSFFASDGFLSSSAYLICVSNVAACSYDTKSEPTAQEVGGTSVATPAMAGVMALINQKAGSAQGSPNAELYKLASQQTYSNCSAESVKSSSTSCYFNDIDTGNNAMACDDGVYNGGVASPNCTVKDSIDKGMVGILSGYSAGTGYDQATGLGSLNVANVVKAWPATVGSAAVSVTVTPAQASITSSQSLGITGTVASSPSGGVTPTGTVTLTAGTYTASAALSNTGSYSFTVPANSLSAGTDTLNVAFSGDTTYAASPTNTAQVTVTAPAKLTPTVTVTPASATLNSDAGLSVPVTVTGTGGTPTGTVTLSGGGYNSGAQPLTSGAYTFTIPANSLSAGSDTLTVVYSGDGIYASVTNSAESVTVTESTFGLTTTTPAAIAPGASATATVTVSSTAGYTGTVTLTCQLKSTTASGGDGATCTGGGEPGVSLTSGTPPGTVTFTVNTKASVAALAYPNLPHGRGRGWAGAGGGAVLALLLFLGVPARRRSWRSMLGVLIVMAALGSLTACGGGGSTTPPPPPPTDPGTTAGVYTYTVQATSNPSVTPPVSTTFTVTVN